MSDFRMYQQGSSSLPPGRNAAFDEEMSDYAVPVLASEVGFPWPGGSKQCTSPEVAKPPILLGDVGIPIVKQLNVDYDQSTKHVLRFVTGYNDVSTISSLTRIKLYIVKMIIQKLMERKIVFLITEIELDTVYCATLKLNWLFAQKELQKTCVNFITNNSDASDKPTIAEVMEILSLFKLGNICLRDVRERHSGSWGPAFDFKRLIFFAEVHGLIECVENTTSA